MENMSWTSININKLGKVAGRHSAIGVMTGPSSLAYDLYSQSHSTQYSEGLCNWFNV